MYVIDSINPAAELVIPRQRHREIQIRQCYCWIPAFAEMTE